MSISIVGLKDILKYDYDEYIYKLENLKSHLNDVLNNVSDKLDIIINFEDIILQSENYELLLEVFSKMRYILFHSNIFLSAILIKIDEKLEFEIKETIIKDTKIHTSEFSNKSIIDIKSLHSTFKGIGLNIKIRNFNRLNEYKIINNFFMPSLNGNSITQYNDIKIEDNVELKDEVMDIIIYNFNYAYQRSASYARYFLPLLINGLKSTSYKNISLDNDGDFNNLPLIVKELLYGNIIKSKIYNCFSTFNILYFVLIDSIYNDVRDNNKITYRVVKELFKNELVIKNKDNYIYDQRIVSEESKNYFLRDFRKVNGNF